MNRGPAGWSPCDYGIANPKTQCPALAMVEYRVMQPWPSKTVVRSYCHDHATTFDNAHTASIQAGRIIRTVL